MAIRKVVLASPGMREIIVSINTEAPPEVLIVELRAIWRRYHALNIVPGSSALTAGPEFVIPLPPP